MLPSVCANKDTVPPREEDFVAHHFSHNAPHRPYIHCTHRGEDEEGAKEKRGRQRLVLDTSSFLGEETVVRKLAVIQEGKNN